jgi:predicted RNA-binding Zn-ribbon protein involved in translation (DUF1610 family)
MAKFNENTKTLPEKKNKLNELYKQVEKMDKSPNIKSSEDIKTRANIRTEIRALEDEINKTSGNSEVLEYISKAGDLLVNYYSITCGIYYNVDEDVDMSDNTLESEIDITEVEPVSSKQSTINSDSGIYISDKLKYLNQLSQKNRKVKKPVKKRRIAQDSFSGRSILQFLPVDKSQESIEKTSDNQMIINRATLQDKYLMLIDKNYACEKSRVDNIVYCSHCKIEKILVQSEGRFVCKVCGETEITIMESEIPNHKEMSNEKQKYPYKKSNHLKEKLNQFQSKESADVPDDICNLIKTDLKKRRIREENCTPPDIRSILKKHRQTQYYEHLQQIYCKISKTDPVTLSRETEETILNMFQAMQESFHTHCPANRSNFLSYSYVLNKLFKILGMNQHAKYFGLLKSKEKLREQDIIWSKICKDMGWKFHSSF